MKRACLKRVISLIMVIMVAFAQPVNTWSVEENSDRDDVEGFEEDAFEVSDSEETINRPENADCENEAISETLSTMSDEGPVDINEAYDNEILISDETEGSPSLDEASATEQSDSDEDMEPTIENMNSEPLTGADDEIHVKEAFSYEVNEDGKTITITGLADESYVIENPVIPSTINQMKVTTIKAEAFSRCENLIGDLTISDGIRVIDDAAFYCCSGLSGGNLNLPDSVTVIGESAFEWCEFEGVLYLPKNLKRMGEGAFNGCRFAGDLQIPDGITEIPDYNFYNCFDGELVLPEGLVKIGAFAFCDCGFVGELRIPDSVRIISTCAFHGCKGFTGDLIIPEGVATIGHGAFGEFSTDGGFGGRLVIPSTATNIDDSAFGIYTVRVIENNSELNLPLGCFFGYQNRDDEYYTSTTGNKYWKEDSIGKGSYTRSDIYHVDYVVFDDLLYREDFWIKVGETTTFTLKFVPENTTNKKVTWKSSNNKRVTVSSSGVVTGISADASAGCDAVLFYTLDDDNSTYSGIPVNITSGTIYATDVVLEKTSRIITVGKTLKLNATVLPRNADNKKVVWKSSDTSVATVSSAGVITGVAEGKAEITVTAPHTGNSSSFFVTVKPKPVIIDDPMESVEEYGLWVGGTRVNSNNMTRIPSVTGNGAKASYDPGRKELTLTNVKGITGSHEVNGDAYKIYSTDTLTIKGDASFSCGCYCGIRSTEDLNIAADLSISDVQAGIFHEKNLTTSGNITVSASATYDGVNTGQGIVGRGVLMVTGGTIEIACDAINRFAIRAKGLSISAGKIRAVTTVTQKSAISFTGEMKMTGGEIEAHQQYETFPAVTAKTFNFAENVVIEIPEGGQYMTNPKNGTDQLVATADGDYAKDVKLVGLDQNLYAKISFQSRGDIIGRKFVKKKDSMGEFLDVPAVSGFKFGGWYYDPEFRDRASIADTVVEDTILYARWIDESNMCTVHFVYPDSYEMEVPDQIIEKGEIPEQPQGPFIYNGNRLVNWALESSQIPYDFNTPIFENITLESVWMPLSSGAGFTARFVAKNEDNFSFNDATKRWEYVYSGHQYTPEIYVGSESGQMTQGTDFSVSISNGKNVSTKKKTGSVKVTGKGQFKGVKKLKFYVVPCPIADDENNPLESILIEKIVVEKGKKIEPVIYCNSRRLTSKDYKLSYMGKVNAGITKVDIIGKGNYTGTIKNVPVLVLDKATLKRSFIQVEFKPDEHVFTPNNTGGAPQTVSVTRVIEEDPLRVERGELTVKDADGRILMPITSVDQMEGESESTGDFSITYLNNTDAGTATVIVTAVKDGLMGTKVLTFKIKPNKNAVIKQYAALSAPYKTDGAKADVNLKVMDSLGSSVTSLEEKKDYKIKYSDNSKVTTTKKAKYRITFLGNYKGHPGISGEYDVVQSGFSRVDLSGSCTGVRVNAADMIYSGKKKYESTPYVSIDNTPLKKNDYKVAYYDALSGESITGKKITLTESEREKLICMEVTGRGNYKAETVKAYYYIRKVNADQMNLSKAKIAVKGDKKKKSVPSQIYTGIPIIPEVDVYVKVKKKWVLVDPSCYKLTYINNVKKGKAIILVTGKGGHAVGTKKTSFNIYERSISLFH